MRMVALLMVLTMVAGTLLVQTGVPLSRPSSYPKVEYEDFYSLERALTVYRIIEEYSRGLKEEERRILVKAIMEESRRYRLDPLFVLAVIETESTYYHRARSRKGARGLMQIRYFVGKDLAREIGIRWRGSKTLYDPVVNVKLGVYYLARLIERFGAIDIALAAYNYGPTYISRLMARGQRLPLYYSNRVLANYRALLERERRYLHLDGRPGESIRVALDLKGIYR